MAFNRYYGNSLMRAQALGSQAAANPYARLLSDAETYNPTGGSTQTGWQAPSAAETNGDWMQEYYGSLNDANTEFQQPFYDAGIPGDQIPNINTWQNAPTVQQEFWGAQAAQQQPSGNPLGGLPLGGFGSYGGGGYGGGGGGGGGGGLTPAQAQALMDEYAALLQGGDPTMGGLQSALGDWRQDVMGSLRDGRQHDLQSLQRMRRRGGRVIRRDARGARRDVRNTYEHLDNYLENNQDNSYRGIRATEADRPVGDGSAAFLADQGAGTGIVDEVSADAGAYAAGTDRVYNQMVRTLAANERSGQQSLRSNSRLDRGDALSNVATQKQSALDNLINQYITGRQGINSAFRDSRTNMLNQFGQQQFGLAGTEATNAQAIRDAMMQLAATGMVDLPPWLFAMGGPQGGGAGGSRPNPGRPSPGRRPMNGKDPFPINLPDMSGWSA